MHTTPQLELTGRVITPGDPDYDKARTIAPGGYDRRPAVIAQVADAADVSRVIGVARESGLAARRQERRPQPRGPRHGGRRDRGGRVAR